MTRPKHAARTMPIRCLILPIQQQVYNKHAAPSQVAAVGVPVISVVQGVARPRGKFPTRRGAPLITAALTCGCGITHSDDMVMLLLCYTLLLASQLVVNLASSGLEAGVRLNTAQHICVSAFCDTVVAERRGLNASSSFLVNLVGSQLLANRTCLCTSPNQVPSGALHTVPV